jgi:ADP-ribosyl-[dinitrogen reductase] hydrolase
VKPATLCLSRGDSDKVSGALLGSWIADALAMPAHWYYDRFALQRDYGRITEFVQPKKLHPDSIFWRSRWDAPSPELDILGDQRPLWGQRGVHYHQGLGAGENTLSIKLAGLLWQMLQEKSGYDSTEYLRRYVDFLIPPRGHRDTYIEECHRRFFSNLGRGVPLEKCGIQEKHIGGLVMHLPIALYFGHDAEKAHDMALENLAMTHPGKEMRLAAEAILSLLLPTLNGRPLSEVILEECSRQRNPFFGFPFNKWLTRDDEEVIGRHLSTACYIDQAVPAVIYLALKYADRPEQGLIANTNLGGDNVHRGGVLGALLGAANGTANWPRRWREGLAEPPILIK